MIHLTFKLTRETKNMKVFSEVNPETGQLYEERDPRCAVGNLYIRKSQVASMGGPSVIKVTINPDSTFTVNPSLESLS